MLRSLPVKSCSLSTARLGVGATHPITIEAARTRRPSSRSTTATMLQALLYKGTMTNLVKMLRNDDFVRVGQQWRPKRVTMQDFKIRTKDVLSLEWKAAAPVPPETFDPSAFAAKPPPAPPHP